MQIDTIISNARIITGDPARARATRLGIFRGQIIGPDEELDGISADIRIDLKGAPVVPGFNDAHCHFSLLGREFQQLDLTPAAAPTLDRLYELVCAAVAQRRPGEWVIARGYDQNKLLGHPNRQTLDRISPHNPVFLAHNSKHMAVANSAAFRASGYPNPDALSDPVGGHISRNTAGQADGLLQEQAILLVQDTLKPVAQATLVEAIAAASRWCLRHGLTSITEPGISGSVAGNGPADVRAFQTARERGLLHTRMTLMPYIDALHSLGPIGDGHEGCGMDLGVRSGLGDDWIRIGAVKIATDGSLIGRTAAMCCEYHDTPGNKGFLQWDAAEMHELLLTAHRNGWQVAAHAIGDHALDAVLNAFDEAQRQSPRADTRHRIEHVALASEAQLQRIVTGGYIPVPQGRFISELGDGFLAALGPERINQVYRMRSFVDAGVILPGSSDAPVVPGEPLLSLHDMVNRRSEGGIEIAAHEGLTPAQALRAYTFGSAYAVHDDHRKGILSRGRLADLVVLSDDLLQVDPARLRDLEVRATMVDGQFRFDAQGELADA